MYERYIKEDVPARNELEKIRVQGDLAGEIYGVRNKLRMTRRDLAEFADLSPETIEDLEESDYEGDWDEAISKVNAGFRKWFEEVIIPASEMQPEEYSVGI
jgi:DNA-binding protein HU-beta